MRWQWALTSIRLRFGGSEEELEELLAPDGELNAAVYKAVRGIVEAERDRGEDASDVEYGALDNAINKYMQYAIEYDRLKRSK